MMGCLLAAPSTSLPRQHPATSFHRHTCLQPPSCQQPPRQGRQLGNKRPSRRSAALAARSAAGAAVPASGSPEEQLQKRGRLAGLLSPLCDPHANELVLSLSAAHLLVSAATLIHDTYLPLYLSEVLHLTHTQIGNLQALSHFLSKGSGSLSGTLADLASPARMVVACTVLTTVFKVMLALTGRVHALLGAQACVLWIAITKAFDRANEAPAKALIGQLAAHCGESPAAAFSLRQAMATLGMLVGAAAAGVAFKLSGGDCVLIFAMAVPPTALALALVVGALRGGSGAGRRGAAAAHAAQEHARSSTLGSGTSSCDTEASQGLLGKAGGLLRQFGPPYWEGLATLCLLYFARFDVSFITLRAKGVIDRSLLPAFLPIMMLTAVLLGPPCGLHAKASVRARNQVLLLGITALMAADCCFAFVPTPAGMVVGALLVGMHMAMSQGISLALLSAYVPSGLSGTAWSLTDLLLGVVLACSNSIAGRMCDLTAAWGWGTIGCFMWGACACALSLLALWGFSTFGSLGREDLVPHRAA